MGLVAIFVRLKERLLRCCRAVYLLDQVKHSDPITNWGKKASSIWSIFKIAPTVNGTEQI